MRPTSPSPRTLLLQPPAPRGSASCLAYTPWSGCQHLVGVELLHRLALPAPKPPPATARAPAPPDSPRSRHVHVAATVVNSRPIRGPLQVHSRAAWRPGPPSRRRLRADRVEQQLAPLGASSAARTSALPRLKTLCCRSWSRPAASRHRPRPRSVRPRCTPDRRAVRGQREVERLGRPGRRPRRRAARPSWRRATPARSRRSRSGGAAPRVRTRARHGCPPAPYAGGQPHLAEQRDDGQRQRPLKAGPCSVACSGREGAGADLGEHFAQRLAIVGTGSRCGAAARQLRRGPRVPSRREIATRPM